MPDATSIRKEVASVLGIGEATLARVVAEHNSSKNEKFSERSERRMQGRPRKSPDHNVVDLIHRFVMTANTSGSPHFYYENMAIYSQKDSYFVYFIL